MFCDDDRIRVEMHDNPVHPGTTRFYLYHQDHGHWRPWNITGFPTAIPWNSDPILLRTAASYITAWLAAVYPNQFAVNFICEKFRALDPGWLVEEDDG